MPFEVKFENIFNYENIIKISCKTDNRKIIYFLSFPINYDTDYDLYLLHPLPTKYKSEFFTIIPNNKYFLKSQNNIKPLNDICIRNIQYQCLRSQLVHRNTTCEEEILLKKSYKACHYSHIDISQNDVEKIEEINQYVAIFPKSTEIKLLCPNQTEIVILKGVFLFKEDICKVFYGNSQLFYKSSSTGQPSTFIDKLSESPKLRTSNISINLRNLKLKEISLNSVTPIEEEDINIKIPSIWTGVLYVLLIITATSFTIKYLLKKCRTTTQPSNPPERIELRLPGEASF